jgi:cell division protein FtsB
VLSVLSLCFVAVLEREGEETKEAESSVAALRRQVASQREAIAALDADIEQYRARVANLRKGQFFLPVLFRTLVDL